MKVVEKGQRYIRKQRADTLIFKRNLNKDKNFTLHGKELMDPFSIIPKSLYQDFDRDKYQRNTITFPINIPINYRYIYLPKQAKRKVIRQPTKPNYASATGNQLLLSLSQYQDYSFNEILEMFAQLANKPKANILQLETNPLIVEALKYMDKQISQMRFKDFIKYMIAIDKLDFQDIERYKKFKYYLFQKYYALEKNDKNAFVITFMTIIKRLGLSEEEWEITKEQTGRYLRKSSPDYIYEFSKILIDNNIVNHYSDYLFEYHIMMGFWKKMGHFKLQHINYFFQKLNEWQYCDFDREFYAEEFLPMIRKKVVVSEDIEVIQETTQLLESFLKFEIEEEYTKKLIDIANKRLEFVKFRLPTVYSTRLVDIVKSDLQKFKEIKIKEKEEKFQQMKEQNQEQIQDDQKVQMNQQVQTQ